MTRKPRSVTRSGVFSCGHETPDLRSPALFKAIKNPAPHGTGFLVFRLDASGLEPAGALLDHHERVERVFGKLHPQIGIALQRLLAVVELLEVGVRRADLGIEF